MRNYPRVSRSTEVDQTWKIEVILPNYTAVVGKPKTRTTVEAHAKAIAEESGFTPISSIEPIQFLGADLPGKWARVRIN